LYSRNSLALFRWYFDLSMMFRPPHKSSPYVITRHIRSNDELKWDVKVHDFHFLVDISSAAIPLLASHAPRSIAAKLLDTKAPSSASPASSFLPKFVTRPTLGIHPRVDRPLVVERLSGISKIQNIQISSEYLGTGVYQSVLARTRT